MAGSLAGALVSLGMAVFPARAAGTGECPDCRMTETESRLCAPHREEEKQVLGECAGLAKSEDVGERLLALKKVAALKDEHANAPSTEAAQFLGKALEDESMRVRTQAVVYLLDGQHPAAALEALLDALDEVHGLQQEIEKELVGLFDRPWNEQEIDPTGVQDLAFGGPEYVRTLLEAVGCFPEERSEKALVAFCGRSLRETPGAYFVAAATGILHQHGRHGLHAVLAWQEAAEQALDSLDPLPPTLARSSLATSRAFGGPKLARYGLTNEKHCLEVVTALERVSQDRGLAGSPPAALGHAREWREFLHAHESMFAEKLEPPRAPIRVVLPASDFRDALLDGKDLGMALVETLESED